jgi:hypothetical protein
VTEVLQWIDPLGVATTLDVEWEVSGRFMPKIETQVDGVPGQPGGLLREARHGMREFLVTVWQSAGSDTALRTALRAFVKAMDPVRGNGKIRVTSPLGDQREITCRYATGLGMDEKLGDASGPDYQKIPVGFVAYDPYWYDVSPTSKTFALTSLPSFFPFFPFHLTASQLVVDDTVNNGGDVGTWPVWTITGPGSAVTLRNSTTGLLISIPSIALTAGQILTIDTRPGVKSVTLNDGTSLFSTIDHTVSQLWSLQDGVNAIRLEMTGITAASALSVSYYQRYLSP